MRYGAAGHSVFEDRRVILAAFLSVLGIGMLAFNAAIPTRAIDAIHIGGLFLALVDAGYLFLLSTFLINEDESVA